MKSRSVTLAILVVAMSVGVALAHEREQLRRFFVGQEPPELVCEASHWMGTSSPTTLAELKGKVIWLQFNF